MGLFSDNTRKTVKVVIRSTRSFNNQFTMFAANLSKGEVLTQVSFTVTEVTPDTGYKAQFEVFYTFTDLVIGTNLLTIKIVGQDTIERSATYIVTREYPHDEFIVSTSDNVLPDGPHTPIPADEATNIQRELQLQWTATDADPLTYDVYFGKSETPSLVVEDLSGSAYPSTGNIKLDAGAIYAWRVIIKQQPEAISEGPTWTFRIAHAPDVPNSEFPIHNSIEVDPSNITLLWQSLSSDNNPLTYDVYFGSSFTPPLVASAIGSKFYNVGTLANNTTYYWKIIVSDNKDNVVPGPKWKFKTGA